MPHLDENDIYNLCKVLFTVDIVQTPEYNVSCFLLISELSFDASVLKEIITKPTPKIKSNHPEDKNQSKLPKINKEISNIKHNNDTIISEDIETDGTEQASFKSSDIIHQILLGLYTYH